MYTDSWPDVFSLQLLGFEFAHILFDTETCSDCHLFDIAVGVMRISCAATYGNVHYIFTLPFSYPAERVMRDGEIFFMNMSAVDITSTGQSSTSLLIDRKLELINEWQLFSFIIEMVKEKNIPIFIFQI